MATTSSGARRARRRTTCSGRMAARATRRRTEWIGCLYRDEDTRMIASESATTPPTTRTGPDRGEPAVTSDWRKKLPVLRSGEVTLRELQVDDAPSLYAFLTTAE